jgi:ribonuclease Z
VNLITERAEALQRLGLPLIPLILLAPNQITSWLQLFHKNFHKIKSSYTLIPNSSLYFQGPAIEPEELRTKILEPLDLRSFQTCGVRHCPNAFGVAFSGNSNWKLTYSGDTMPCDYLVELGQDSDVLIHEATMEDELKEEAVYKMHSTVSEAIEIGRRMNAKFTLLTHFSQRYAKVPKIGNELEENVGIAFDNMCVRLSDIRKIPLMYPALKTMFAEHYEEMEIKTAKKMRRKEKLLNAATGGGNGLEGHILLQDQEKVKSSKIN